MKSLVNGHCFVLVFVARGVLEGRVWFKFQKGLEGTDFELVLTERGVVKQKCEKQGWVRTG